MRNGKLFGKKKRIDGFIENAYHASCWLAHKLVFDICFVHRCDFLVGFSRSQFDKMQKDGNNELNIRKHGTKFHY